MKRIINERKLRSIIREALKEIDKQTLKKHHDEDMMWRKHGNPNRFDDRDVEDKFDPRNNGKGDWYRDDRKDEKENGIW